jgi:hypothetical protein
MTPWLIAVRVHAGPASAARSPQSPPPPAPVVETRVDGDRDPAERDSDEHPAQRIEITFYPFLMMDVPAGKALPNPYSDNAAELGQAVLPWRGRITCSPAAGYAGSVDRTAAATAQVAAYFGSAQPHHYSVSGTSVSWTGSSGDRGLRRMILHYAHLCAAAGGVDAFLIGSEMRGLTQFR